MPIKQGSRVLLDTSVWISFLIGKALVGLEKTLIDKKLVLLYSKELIEEFLEVAQRPKFKAYFQKDTIQNVLKLFEVLGISIEVTSTVNVCRDVNDNFFTCNC